MSLSAKLKLTTNNPNYPGPGEYSTMTTEVDLNYDPLFKHLSIVPVKMSGGNTVNFEVRNKEWEVDTTSNPSPMTVAMYSLSSLGVKQPN